MYHPGWWSDQWKGVKFCTSRKLAAKGDWQAFLKCPGGGSGGVSNNLLNALMKVNLTEIYGGLLPEDYNPDDLGPIDDPNAQFAILVLFNLLDQDNNGSVTGEELKSVHFSRDWIPDIAGMHAQLVFKVFDQNKNGFIDVADFMFLHSDKRLMRKIAKYVIRLADWDDDKQISSAEMKLFIETLHQVVFDIMDQNDDEILSIDDLEYFKVGHSE